MKVTDVAPARYVPLIATEESDAGPLDSAHDDSRLQPAAALERVFFG